MNPLFSVICPTLGKLNQWKMSIQSVLDQDFKDFEIIAIDSGPEGKSYTVIKSLNDRRIKYFNVAEKDPRLNWDFGFRESNGQYVIWFDDDNYMLPHQLSQFAEVIKGEGADLITGAHVHWRGFGHPIESARNQLIIPTQLFSGKVSQINPKEIIRNIFLSSAKPGAVATRVGISMSTARRDLVENLLGKMREINFGTTGTHALRIGLLALAKKYFFIDKPLTIGAQAGTSYSDVWPKQSSKIKLPRFEYNFSKVTGNTYTNYRHENHLLIKKYLSDELAEFDDDKTIFLETYARELAFIDPSWMDLAKKWSELFRFIRSFKNNEANNLKKRFLKYIFYAIIIKFLRMAHFYGFVKKIFENRRKSKKNKIVISLDKYGVENIRDCAQKMPEVIEKELKIPYSKFCHLNP